MNAQTKVFRAHRALALLYGVLGALGASLMTYNWRAFEGPFRDNFVLFVGALGALCIIHYVVAGACKQGKRWGRKLTIVIAFISLGFFPIGTLIGIDLLWNSWRPWNSAV